MMSFLSAGRQISFATGTSRTYTPGASGSNSGKQRAVISQANGQILHEGELAFLADPGTGEVALMANLSHYGSDALAELHNPDNVDNNMINQGVQAVVQNSNSSTQQDALILSVIEQQKTQVVNCTKINLDNKSVNDTLLIRKGVCLLIMVGNVEEQERGFAWCLKALDEGCSSKNYVRKFLRALHPKWRAKVTTIEESKDLSSLALDETARMAKSESGKEDDEKAKDKTCLVAQASSDICLGVDLEHDEWIKDSGCSKHITGNRKLISTYKACNEGNVIFGSNLRGNVIGKGQICDNKCKVTFSEHDSEITKDGKFMGRASKELVRNLPKLKFDQHFCDACKIRKQAHTSHKAKNIVSTTKCLELLHMDLFGPSSVWSYEGNLYTFVIVDDYSRTDHGRDFDNEVQFG
ncbi:hypothetical protein Tco_0595161 [Tanacetum coccineum]